MSLKEEATNHQGRNGDVEQSPIVVRDLVIAVIAVLCAIAIVSLGVAWR